MRVLSTFLTLLIVISLLAIGGFFLARELFLWWGVNSFKASVQELQGQAQSGSYAAQCTERNQEGGVQIAQTHLRFTSDTEFVIEAVCDHFSGTPILISKNHLPPYISKVPGSSGIVWGAGRSAIELRVFESLLTEIAKFVKMDISFLEKSRVIGIEENVVIVLDGEEEELGTGPVTSCEGYGFQCCKAESHIGVGERITGLNECKDSCYRSCSSRPLVLAFNTSPLFDPRTRQVSITPNAAVDFSYVGDAPGASTLQASIDFGDGSLPTRLDGMSGKTTHVYTCGAGSCTYVAKLKLVDNWQVESYESPISTIQVLVQAQ